MLGHHTPIKCFEEILSLPLLFQESIAIEVESKPDLTNRYHEFILETMSSWATGPICQRSSLISIANLRLGGFATEDDFD